MSPELAFGLAPRTASVLIGAGLGLAFGFLAERTKFCLRRTVVGGPDERPTALGVWAIALAVALAGTTLAITSGLIDLADHRFFAARLPILAIVVGGLLFGIGMVLARGCASRLTVLAGSGNLRALTVLLVFAAVAHATLKGALAPIRTGLASYAVDLGGFATLAALPGGAYLWSSIVIAALLAIVVRSGAQPGYLVGGALIGALAPLGWIATGWLLKDEFDPIPAESIALTSAGAETLFWWVASSAIQPTFGVGFLAGIVGGSFVSALLARRFRIDGFTNETPTGRYLGGGVLMGIGGVLAGGCTIGAGLAGVATLSVAAILAFASIVTGAWLTGAVSRIDLRGEIVVDEASASAVLTL